MAFVKSNASSCEGVLLFGICLPEASCKYFTKIPRESQCAFVRALDDCADPAAYIQYMEVFACNYNDYPFQIYYEGLSIVLTEMILLFLVLGTTADSFFAPSLCAVANMMGMSENVAGVTLLAMGNSAPDLLTSLTAASYLGHELVSCQILGGGIFVTAFVAALVLLKKQFHAIPYYFWRDTIFYLIAISWTFIICNNKRIHVGHTMALVGIYLVYIIVVALEPVVWRKMKKKDTLRLKSAVDDERHSAFHSVRMSSVEDHGSYMASFMSQSSPRSSHQPLFTLHHAAQDAHHRGKSHHEHHHHHHRHRSGDVENGVHHSQHAEQPMFRMRKSFLPNRSLHRRSPVPIAKEIDLPPPNVPHRRSVVSRFSFVDAVIEAERLSLLKRAGMTEKVAEERDGNPETMAVEVDGEPVYVKLPGLWEDFLNEMVPIDEEEWEEGGLFKKFMLCLQAPIIYIFKLIIPVIDHCSLKNGWCKLLGTIHCVTCPLFSVFTARVADLPPEVYFPLVQAVVLVGGCLAALVFMTSKVDEPPRYHIAFAFSGFIVSIQMIYNMAHELMFLMDVTGNLLSISVATLAMTVLAWGNSVGDMVANVALAGAGYPRMGWAGCFGSPLAAATVGAGISLSLLVETNGVDHMIKIRPRYMPLLANCFFFLFLSLFSSLFIIPMLNYQCRRSYGTYLILVYLMFLSYSFLCEFGVISPLRSESRKDMEGTE